MRKGKISTSDSLCVKQKECFYGLGTPLKDQASQENIEVRLRLERVKKEKNEIQWRKEQE